MRIVFFLVAVALILQLGCRAPEHGGERATTPQSAVNKRALLIGVVGYEFGRRPTERWRELNTTADIEAIRTVLINRFGFDSSNITVLNTRRNTTGGAIRAAMANLREATKPGDIVYFHYSGHGSRVTDGADRDESDFSDATLVPSDYTTRSDGSRDIRDDEIRDWLVRFAREDRRPANITLVFDCCFSGTMTRAGRHAVRGSSRGLSGAPSPSRGSGLLDVAEYNILPVNVISATRHNFEATELDANGDGKDDMGRLTFALTRALTALTLPPSASDNAPTEMAFAGTYRDLHERVVDEVTRGNPLQTPVFEGRL